MQVIKVRNAHEALPEAVALLIEHGQRRESRNGPVLVYPTPVTTMYHKPCERVLFWDKRDANPFLHLFESLWMLGGRNDVAYLTQFVSRFKQYSDNGETLHGAYGHRWRKAFGFDQLQVIIERLRENRDDRRQVLGIWDPTLDLSSTQNGKRDIPCNLVVHFQISVAGTLDMTVFNRSNDIVWGCYGANVVHFSILQEYMAAWIGVPVGYYWQISDNWHGYLETIEPLRDLAYYRSDVYGPKAVNPYDEFEPWPLIVDPSVFSSDLHMFLAMGPRAIGYREPFIRHVAVPMMQIHSMFRDHAIPLVERIESAIAMTRSVRAPDWCLAARQWLERRLAKAKRQQDDGVRSE